MSPFTWKEDATLVWNPVLIRLQAQPSPPVQRWNVAKLSGIRRAIIPHMPLAITLSIHYYQKHTK
jgi:hypothetical protein